MNSKIDTITNTATPSGVFAAVFGWATLNDWALVLGVAIAFLSACVNLWHKRRMVALREREVAAIERRVEQ